MFSVPIKWEFAIVKCFVTCVRDKILSFLWPHVFRLFTYNLRRIISRLILTFKSFFSSVIRLNGSILGALTTRLTLKGDKVIYCNKCHFLQIPLNFMFSKKYLWYEIIHFIVVYCSHVQCLPFPISNGFLFKIIKVFYKVHFEFNLNLVFANFILISNRKTILFVTCCFEVLFLRSSSINDFPKWSTICREQLTLPGDNTIY